MKRLLLERCRSSHTEVQGFLSFMNGLLATIERPWIEGQVQGGKPFESCVPDGTYELIPHTRNNKAKDRVVALVNHDLGVYYRKDDMPPEGGRYKVLIHVGNWSKDVVGCIAPGQWKTDSEHGPMVSSSRNAMNQIMKYINGQKATIEIRWI